MEYIGIESPMRAGGLPGVVVVSVAMILLTNAFKAYFGEKKARLASKRTSTELEI